MASSDILHAGNLVTANRSASFLDVKVRFRIVTGFTTESPIDEFAVCGIGQEPGSVSRDFLRELVAFEARSPEQ